MVVATDRHYTQGLRLSYFHRDDDLPFGSRWLSVHLPEFGFENVVGRLGYSIGQNIYTPANIRLQRPQPNDRPYAGWLYLGATLQRRGWSFGRHLTEEQFSIEAGVIGPWALAGEAQTWVHDMRDLTEPRGWDNQLKNEPGLRLKYSRGVRFVVVDNGESGIDVIPRIGFSAGNVDTSARATTAFHAVACIATVSSPCHAAAMPTRIAVPTDIQAVVANGPLRCCSSPRIGMYAA